MDIVDFNIFLLYWILFINCVYKIFGLVMD